MSTPVELAREEIRERQKNLALAVRQLSNAQDEVAQAQGHLLVAQRELIRELDKLPARSHKKKVAL